MNFAKRAIIMAAGLGSRLNPITQQTPKPLIRVNGIRMIDTVIRALHNNGIREIHIVVGYLRDQFQILEKEYEGIHLIENPFYATCNNISSLYVAREYIENAIIVDGDQIVFNEAILAPEFDKSGYNAIWTENGTDEWLMQVEKNRVVSCSRTGGAKGWQLYGISRWTSEDGKRLRKHLEFEFEERKNRQIYWDDVAMFYHFEDYDLGIWPMHPGDIIEIDNLEELRKLDPSYTKELKNI